MKTQTPKWAIWARSLLVLPVAALLLYGFSTREVVERKPETAKISEYSVLEVILDLDGNLLRGKEKFNMDELRKIIESGSFSRYDLKVTEGAPEEKMPELVRLMASYKLPGSVTTCTTSGAPIADQEKATPEMIRKYNDLAKHYNAQSGLLV